MFKFEDKIKLNMLSAALTAGATEWSYDMTNEVLYAWDDDTMSIYSFSEDDEGIWIWAKDYPEGYDTLPARIGLVG